MLCDISILYYFTIIFGVLNCIQTDEVDEYLNLIGTELFKAAKYKERTNNEDIYTDENPNDITDFGNFDYIIVGAGSAGSIVAKRLSENKFKTLLIEAGDNETNYTDIPAMFRQLQFSDNNWGYYTSPQKYTCQGMIGTKCATPQGKVMGGTSTIGGLVYIRGTKLDQDLWSSYGITDWSWDDCLPYYKQLENYQQIYGDPGYHGYHGPVPMDYARPSNYLENIFLNANKEVYNITNDINGKTYMAAGKMHFIKKNGRRYSSSKSYLSTTNKYLTITTKSYAYKILFNKYKKAVGVEFMKHFKRYQAFNKFEVIISGGVINSPHVLMLSGIGPKEQLDKYEIPLVKDLPVGRNLVGHIGFHGLQFKSDLKLYDKSKPVRDSIWEYLSGVGPLANIAIDGLAFLSTDNSTTNPDIEVFIASRGELNVTANNEWNFDQESLDTFTPPKEDMEYVFRIAILLIKASSKGTVTLQSSNPKDFPLIDINSLSDPDDIERIFKGINYVNLLLTSKAFKDINVELLKTVLPACRDFDYLSQDYWYCTIRHISGTANHPVGTCKMGSGMDSVVDNRLRVLGVKSLRVVDLSVAPRVNSLHTNALAMMIGEKAADLIREDHWTGLNLLNLF